MYLYFATYSDLSFYKVTHNKKRHQTHTFLTLLLLSLSLSPVRHTSSTQTPPHPLPLHAITLSLSFKKISTHQVCRQVPTQTMPPLSTPLSLYPSLSLSLYPSLSLSLLYSLTFIKISNHLVCRQIPTLTMHLLSKPHVQTQTLPILGTSHIYRKFDSSLFLMQKDINSPSMYVGTYTNSIFRYTYITS